jgi:hypothetical protein
MKKKGLILSFCLAAQASRLAFAQAPDGEISPPSNVDSGLLWQLSTDAAAQASGPNLVYMGGPILSNAKVHTVFWGPNVANPDRVNAFYEAITASPLMAWLSEYDTPTAKIGTSKLAGSTIDLDAPLLNPLPEDVIQAELGRLIDSGLVPEFDENTFFAVHLPQDIQTQTQGVLSCVNFLGYHSLFKHGGRSIYYTIIPDCGFGEGFITKVSTHELTEVVTNPNWDADPAWVDRSFGEIADICTSLFDVVNGIVVQKLWSNQAKGCITTKLPPPENDFAFVGGMVTGRRSVPGEVIELNVATSITHGVAQDITLSIQQLPPHVTAEFLPPTVRAGETAKLRLTFGRDAQLTPNTVPFIIFGTNSFATHAAQSVLFVVPSIELVTNGGFESSFSGWSIGGDQTPFLTNHAFDGKASLELGSDSFGAGTNSFAFTTVTIPTGQIRPILSFWNQPITTGTAPDSFQEALVLDTAGNPLQTIFHVTANHDWERQTVDLSAFLGQTIRIRFATRNGDPTTATSLGIDDVSLAIRSL